MAEARRAAPPPPTARGPGRPGAAPAPAPPAGRGLAGGPRRSARSDSGEATATATGEHSPKLRQDAHFSRPAPTVKPTLKGWSHPAPGSLRLWFRVGLDAPCGPDRRTPPRAEPQPSSEASFAMYFAEYDVTSSIERGGSTRIQPFPGPSRA